MSAAATLLVVDAVATLLLRAVELNSLLGNATREGRDVTAAELNTLRETAAQSLDALDAAIEVRLKNQKG